MEQWDDVGFVLYREMLRDVIPLRRETFGEGLHVHKPSDVRGTFSLIVPKLPRAVTLALYGPPVDVDRWGEASSVIFTFDLTTI
jgi:hypothetical protein